MPSVHRYPLMNKRKRTTFQEMACPSCLLLVRVNPGITSLPFSQFKHREVSGFIYSTHPLACEFSLIQRLWSNEYEGEGREGMRKRRKKEGTVFSFDSCHPPFKGQILENSTKGQESFTLATPPSHPWHPHTVIKVNVPTPLGVPSSSRQPLHMPFLFPGISFFLLLCLEKSISLTALRYYLF